MAVNLEKRTEAAQVSLVKTLTKAAAAGVDLGTVEAQVVMVIDYSGSMDHRFTKGEPQELAERSLALSLAGLDDDGNIQIVFMDHQAYEPITVDGSNYSTAIEDWRTISPAVPGTPGIPGTGMFKRGGTPATPGNPAIYRRMGGTNYLPAIERVLRLVREDLRDDIPTFVLFITDGKTDYEDEIKKALIAAAPLPVFWQFLGLGYEPAFLKTLNTMGDRIVDNVGLVTFQDTSSISDADFFDKVTREFLMEWLPAARLLRIVK